jgi:hypothetical protein
MASLVLFLWEVRHVHPGAWHEMRTALDYRMARGEHAIPWGDWWPRISQILTRHIQPVAWLLAAAGSVITWRAGKGEPVRWLGWVASCFFILSAVYVVGFRNASSVHDYASFYFTVPVALMAGVALDALCQACAVHGPLVRGAVLVCILALVGLLVATGLRETERLRHQFLILSDDQPEPVELIPELGKAIHAWFGTEDVAVICNFLPTYGPQLHYYAQHEFLGCVYTPEEWRQTIADPENSPLGGVIWLGEPHAEDVLASLPSGEVKRITIAHRAFCFWRPSEASQ